MRRSILALVLLSTLSYVLPASGQHFRYVRTRPNHSLLILESLINGESVEAGDEVGVFTPGGMCAGALVYDQEAIEQGAGVAAWGDDPDEAGINGFRGNERINYRFWDRGTNHEVVAEPEYIQGPEVYTTDAFSLLTLSAVLEGPPELAVESEHDFGNVLVDAVAAWEMTVTNAGIDPLTIESLTSDEDGFTHDFPEEEVTLEAGQEMVVNVEFAPTEERAYEGSLTFVSNNDGGDVVVQLVGNGVIERIADIEVRLGDVVMGGEENEIGFGEVELGHPAGQDLTINNIGNADLTLSEVTVDGEAFSSNFGGETVIGAGERFVLSVTFDPAEEIDYNGTLTLVSDDPDEGEVSVTLTGTGFIPPQPDISVDPESIGFGEVVIGQRGTQILTISNVGDQPLNIGSIFTDNEAFTTDFEAEEQEGPRFRFTQTDGNHSILVLTATINGSPLEVDDEIGLFTPAGQCAGAVIIEEVGANVGLAAWGDDAGEAGVLGFRAGEAIAFRFWDLSARREFAAEPEVIQGNLQYERDAFTIVNLRAGQGRQPADIFELTLEPGGSAEVSVFFDPAEIADYEGILTIISNDPDSDELEVPLSGRGVAEPPVIVVAEGVHDFGVQVIGSSTDWTFSLSNTGGSDLEGEVAFDFNAGDGGFSINNEQFSIEPDQSLDMTVTFSPEAVGDYVATLHLLSNDPEVPDLAISLEGSGREPAPQIVILNAPINFGQVFAGETVEARVQFENRGEAALEVESFEIEGDGFSAQFEGGFTVDPQAEGELWVSFSPAEERDYAGTFTIITNDPITPRASVDLIGQGVLERIPNIQIDSDHLDFLAIIIGGERSLNIEGQNIGLANLTISRVEVEGEAFFSGFGEDPIVVASNEGFALPITFRPDQPGIYEGMATIFSDDEDSPEVVVHLMGRAIPEGIHFEFQITADNMSVIIEDAILDDERLIEGDEVGVFTPDDLCAGAVLVEGEWPLGVAVWGEDANQEGIQGFRAGEELVWKFWDQSSGREFVARAEYVVGEGVYVTNGFSVVNLESRHEPTPAIRLGAVQIDFGLVLIEESRTQSLRVMNFGDGDLVIESLETSGAPFSADFDEQVVIEPEGHADFELTFTPGEAGEFMGTATFFSNDPDNPEVSVDLRGEGIEPSPPMIVLSAESHNFGDIGIGESEEWTLTISNNGGEVLSVEAPEIAGAGFAVTPEEAFELNVGESRQLIVAFMPEEAIEYEATLLLRSNDQENGVVGVILRGAGDASPLHWRFIQTDGNMSLLIENVTLGGEQVPMMAEIGVFTPGGLTAGVGRIEEFPLGVAAWGDDANTADVVEGFREGEALIYRLWMPELGMEFDAIPDYSDGEGIYHRDAFSVLTLSAELPEGQAHFHYSITESNHSLLILSAILNDEPLAAGDEVGVFTPGGVCAGAAILEADGMEPFGLAAWSDDRGTQVIEGFTAGQPFAFRYWDADAEREYSGVEAMYEEGEQVYVSNAFTVLRLDLYALPQPEISYAAAHDFGRVAVGENVVWEMVIANEGDANLVITEMTPPDAPFHFAFEEEVVIAGGESASFEVSFVPEEAGEFASSLLISSNDRNEGEAVVNLIGTAFNPNRPPVWTNPPEVLEGEEGTLIEFELAATDPDQDALVLSMTANDLPEGAVFNDNENGTGSFEWTPGYTEHGDYSPSFTVSDGQLEVTIQITISISDIDAPPAFVDMPQNLEISEIEELQVDIQGIDPDGDEFEMTFEFVGNQPGNAPEYVLIDEGFSRLTWTPGFEDAGEYTVRFHLLSDHADQPDVFSDVTVTVIDVNRAPVVANPIDDYVMDEDAGREVVADLNQVFADSDGDELSFSIDAPEELGAMIDEDDMFSLTPAENFNGEGLEVIITASDGRDFARAAIRPNSPLGAAQANNRGESRNLRAISAIQPITALSRDAEIADEFMVTVLPVNDAPEWITFPEEPFVLNETARLQFDVSAADIDGDDLVLSFDAGNFPEEATVTDNGDGTASFDWQTNFASAGNYRGELIASDGEVEEITVFFVTVRNINRVPAWDDIPENVQGDEGQVIRFDVIGSDLDGDDLTIEMFSDDLPDAAEMQDHDDGTGTFVWQPSFDEAGQYSAIFRLADRFDHVDHEITFIIDHVNRRPVLAQGLPDRGLNEDADRTDLFDLDGFFSDPDGDNLEFSIQADENLSVSVNNQGTLSVDPADNINGAFVIRVIASDGPLNVSDEFTLTISERNDPPFWVDPIESVEATEGERIEFTLNGDDIDLDFEGDELITSLSVEDGIIEHGAEFDANGASCSITWDTDFNDAGEYSPVFRIEDQAGVTVEVTVEITINNRNRAPVILEPEDADEFTVDATENRELRVEFDADDPDGDDIEWVMTNNGGMPQGFEFTDHGDGTATLLWTPPFDARRQPYTPSFRARDTGGLNDNITVNINVANTNRDPRITAPADADIHRVQIQEGQLLTVDFTSNDPDGGNPGWALADRDDLPNGFNFQDNGNGTARFTWRPDFNASRENDPYTPLFQTTDADGGTDEITIEITVLNVNQEPVITEPSDEDVVDVEVDEGQRLQVNFVAQDDDGDGITWEMIAAGGLPEEAEFTDNGDGTASLDWQTDFDDARDYAPQFRAFDDDGLEDIITVNITVNNVNRAPVVRDAIEDLVVDEDPGRVDVANLAQVFSDPDGDQLQFQIAGAPQELAMALEGSILFFQSDDNYNLPAGVVITVSATDGTDQVDEQFRITITPVNDQPGTFDLLSPDNNAVLDQYRGVFSWSRSIDVDGDQIGYIAAFSLIDAPIDTTFRFGPLADTSLALAGLDTLMSRYGLGDSVRVEWWVEATDGQLTRESNQRRRVVVPPPNSAPGDGELLPTEISLGQNYPNPFNPETSIQFALPKPSDVKISIYDTQGRLAALVVNGRFEAGRHELHWNADGRPAGVYLFILEANGERRITKSALVR